MKSKKLSIIIPVYNEEKTVAKLLKQVMSAKLPKGVKKEIIVVDDGSRDKSVNKINSAKKQLKIQNLKLFSHKTNKGKGAAIRTGIQKASGEIIIIQDADLEYDPNDYTKLLDPILVGKAKVVYGTRFVDYPLYLTGKDKTPLVTHYVGNKFLTLLTNVLFGSKLTDMETCYKVFESRILKGLTLNSNRFEFEPEVTAKVLRKGINICEIPIKVKPRSYAEGKKITWRDGATAVWTLIKYRFVD